MTQEERDNEVSEFLSKVIKQLPHFLDNKIMDSFANACKFFNFHFLILVYPIRLTPISPFKKVRFSHYVVVSVIINRIVRNLV
jgi:hypothetical protein